MPTLPPQILREFLDQSTGLLDRVDHDIAEVDRTGDPALGTGIASAFRSIRSGAAFLELSDLEAAATRAEKLLKEFKTDSLEVARRELAALREAVQSLRSGATCEIDLAGEAPVVLTESEFAEPAAAQAGFPDPTFPDAAAISAASHVESRTSPEPMFSQAPAVTLRPLAALLEQTRTIIANVAARTSRDLHAEVRGGEVEADESVCQSLHGALKVIVAHTSSHTVAATDPAAPAPTINITAEPEGANICIRVESPVSSLDTWSADPHLDAARTAVEQMLGSLTLSADGVSATSIALRVPASPLRFPAMIVRAGSVSCAIPTAQIDEIATPASAPISGSGEGRTVQFRGQSLPLLDASRIFAGVAAHPAPKHILILRAAGRRIALAVDRAVGVQEVAPEATPVQGDASNRGWASLPDGSRAIVADVPSIVRNAVHAEPLSLAA